MKDSLLSRMLIVLCIQAVMLLPERGYGYYPEKETLSPALIISQGLFAKIFSRSDVLFPEGRFHVHHAAPEKRQDGYRHELEVTFRYDHPGIMRALLAEIIGPDHEVIWQDMLRGTALNRLRFGIKTKEESQIYPIIDAMRSMRDFKKANFVEKKHKKYVLEIECPQDRTCLINFANYLAEQGINISQFLSFPSNSGKLIHYIFEIDIPRTTDIARLDSELMRLITFVNGRIEMRTGQLIDMVLDDYLLQGVRNIPFVIDRNGRRLLRQALKVIAERRISEARRDRKTPFVMHPLEIVRILVQEIKMFDPELISYFSDSLQMPREEVVISIIKAAILHDAVEDKDISQKYLARRFGSFVGRIVDLVTKQSNHKFPAGEKKYLRRLAEEKNISGRIAQLIKIADRIHNVRTLEDNSQEFQRKIFFSTWDNFYEGELLNTLEEDSNKFDNKHLQDVFARAFNLFRQEVKKTGLKLGFIDEQSTVYQGERTWYEWEEKARLLKQILTIAEQKQMIAHGVSEEKAGLQGLANIVIDGYIRARSTKAGQVVFAGPLRLQGANEDFNDYQTGSAGSYGPYYVILNLETPQTRQEDFVIKKDIQGETIVLPGFIRAERIDADVWGLSHAYHAAYLVPAESDRAFIVEQLKYSGKSHDYTEQAMKKIVTYEEFIQCRGDLQKYRGDIPFLERTPRVSYDRLISESI